MRLFKDTAEAESILIPYLNQYEEIKGSKTYLPLD